MRRSNTKAFKNAVKAYYDTIVTSPAEQQELEEAFWTYYADHKNLELNHKKSFENFVNSCSTNFAFETFEQRQLLKDWYGETKAQSERCPGEMVSERFCYIITEEFERRGREQKQKPIEPGNAPGRRLNNGN